MISAGSLPTHKAVVRLHTDSDEHKQECRNGTGHYFPKRKSLDEIRHWSPVCVWINVPSLFKGCWWVGIKRR